MLKKSYLLLRTAVLIVQVARSQQYNRTATGVITHTTMINIEVQFFTPSIIRVTKYLDSLPPSIKSPTVTKAADKVDLKVVQVGYELFITSSALQVKVNQQSGQVNFYTAAQFPLLDEKEEAFQFARAGNPADKLYRVTQAFQLDLEEAVFGLGGQQKGVMNQRGQAMLIKHDNPAQTAPFMLSVKGYGLLWDNCSTTIFKDGATGTFFESEKGAAIDYYFIHGGTADNVIAGYRRLSGPPALYPQWVFGKGRTGKEDLANGRKYRHAPAVQSNAPVAQFASVTANAAEDLSPQWALFRAQIAAGCNSSINGLPYFDSEINKYLAKDKFPNAAKDPAFQELYVRWLQFAALCPIMSTEGETVPGGIYQFGKKGYWAYDAIEKFIDLRNRFLPYTYSNAWDVASQSDVMMRSLALDFPSEKQAWNLNNEYLLGKSLMVCPVTSSLYISKVECDNIASFNQRKTKKIYLPYGSDWFDFWTGEKFKGGTDNVFKDITIDLIPMYVKSGSIIPMILAPEEATTSAMEIRVYPGADGSFTLYEDENDGNNYEKGMFSTIPMKWNDETRTLTIGARKGNYPGMLLSRSFKVVVVNDGRGIGMNPTGIFHKSISYTGAAVNIKL